MGKKIEYTNGELTIIWQPELCQHAGICVKTLPGVYKPKERPWIQIENATTAELIAQINQCPSGALTYRMNKEVKCGPPRLFPLDSKEYSVSDTPFFTIRGSFYDFLLVL